MSTHNIPLIIQQRKSPLIIPNMIISAAMEFFSKGLKNEFETAMVNEPLVFKLSKFYCILMAQQSYSEL